MRNVKVEGIILKRSNFGEADKLLTVFTRKLGKISVLAKGVRRIKSRRAPHLELFNRVELLLHHSGTAGFTTVTEAKVWDNFAHTKSDLKLSGYLFYLAEVIDKILPEHQPHPEIYQSLVNTVRALPSGQDKIIKEFVVQLLWDLGYLPRGKYPKLGVTNFVESIVEKRVRSKKFLEEI